MIFEQYYLGCLAHASYMIIDERTHSAVVVDPQRDIDRYLEDAKRHGATIRHVLLTHYHADFVAGHIELAARTGARIGLGSAVAPEYDAELYADGAQIELGDVRIEVLHTPGHTPESVTYLVYDQLANSEVPLAALTGDTLFIGDVGRPDLLASIGFSSEQLAAMLYESLHGKLMKLDDGVLVYPAHGAGSMCGKALSDEKVSTIGQQRASNYALQPMSKDEFIRLVSAGQPEAPQYFVHDAILNRKQRPTLEQSLKEGTKALSLEDVMRLGNAGAVLLDVREADAFAKGHLRGSLNIGLSGKFATWAGYVIEPRARIVLIGFPDQIDEAAVRLGRIGLDKVVGYLAGGPAAWKNHSDLVRSFERVGPKRLAMDLAAEQKPLVIDVRAPGEFEGGAIEGAVNIPLQHLEERQAEIPRDRRAIVVCRSGYRSALGASLLERAGFRAFTDLEGGMQAWEAASATASA